MVGGKGGGVESSVNVTTRTCVIVREGKARKRLYMLAVLFSSGMVVVKAVWKLVRQRPRMKKMREATNSQPP